MSHHDTGGGFADEDTGRMAGDKGRGTNGLEARVARLERDADRLYSKADKLDESLRAVLTALGDMKVQLANATRTLAAARHLEVPAWLIATALGMLAALQIWQAWKGGGG